MSTRQHSRAIARAADVSAGRALILGRLLLLISP
jgi:hypothetical protein